MDEEIDVLLHVILTGDMTWDPTVLDHNHADDETWYDAMPNEPDGTQNMLFDEIGNCHKRTVMDAEMHFFDALEPAEDPDDAVITS